MLLQGGDEEVDQGPDLSLRLGSDSLFGLTIEGQTLREPLPLLGSLHDRCGPLETSNVEALWVLDSLGHLAQEGVPEPVVPDIQGHSVRGDRLRHLLRRLPVDVKT